MKHGWSFAFALALFTLPALASAATPADELLRASRYPSLKAAVHAFVDAGSEPVRVQRLLAADGSAYYRLEGEATGRRQVPITRLSRRTHWRQIHTATANATAVH